MESKKKIVIAVYVKTNKIGEKMKKKKLIKLYF
jgi:hypothetical protein